jgi:CubicO group peptidase (beta-lactamase class C family)
MKQIISTIICIACLFSIAHAQNEETIKTNLSSLMKDAETKDVFGGSVLVIQKGKTVYEESIGMADVDKKISNTSATKFSLGSITKIFTKTIVLQLIEERKIKAEEKIITYLPGFTDERAAEITIEQLMEHTSGLGDYAGAPEWEATSEEINNITQLLAHIQKQPLLFKPGTKVQYSNSGYAVLAALIEKITGKKLGNVYREKIFDKLNMNNSGFAETNKELTGKAIGYLTNFTGPKRNNLQFKEMGAGDGGLYSTTGDLWKFAQSIKNDNVLLKDESKLKLFNTPLFPVHYVDWTECKTKGRLSIAGGAPGVSAVMSINMEKDYFFAVLSNYDEGCAETVAQRIAAILNNRDYAKLPLPPARFIYSLIEEKGPDNFTQHYKDELQKANIELEDDMILLSVGETLLEEKNADAALALYTVYTKEFPNIVVAWNDMGDAYLLKGNKPDAKKCFEQALKLRPGNPRAQRMLKELQ